MSRITIGKWGGSLAVRLPKQIAEEMNLTEDMKLKSSLRIAAHIATCTR